MALDLLYPLVQFLISLGRNNFVSILYQIGGSDHNANAGGNDEDTAKSNMFTSRQGFITTGVEDGLKSILFQDNSIYAAMIKHKEDG